MKPMLCLSLVFVLTTLQSRAQTNPPEGFQTGTITIAGGTPLQGFVKDNIRSKAEVLFLSADGKKKKYTASEVLAVTADSVKYIVQEGVFYKVVREGARLHLLKKASSVSGKIEYNGSEPVAYTRGEGGYDDYFIQPAGGKPQLVRKKDFDRVLTAAVAGCPTVLEAIQKKELGFGELEQVIDKYNACQ